MSTYLDEKSHDILRYAWRLRSEIIFNVFSSI